MPEKKNMKILLVEDDPKESARIKTGLKEQLKTRVLEFVEISSESEFRGCFEDGGDLSEIESCEVGVLDLMVIWERTRRAPTPQPREVEDGGVENAGFRCLRFMVSNPATAKIPCLIYTHMNPSECPAGAVIVAKHSDLRPLAEAILEATQN